MPRKNGNAKPKARKQRAKAQPVYTFSKQGRYTTGRVFKEPVGSGMSPEVIAELIARGLLPEPKKQNGGSK